PGSSVDDSANDILKENVEHWAFFCQEREKINLLRSLLAVLKEKKSVKALIFTGKGSQVEKISSRLKHHKLPAAGLWGGMDKGSRKQALDSFRSGKIRFLATSDLAARGLDIAGVSHVISLDLGEDKNIYIHRAGRTARAGNNGFMISIGTEAEMYRLKALEKKLGITVYPKILYGGRILAPDE
ncbi:MAG: C-terminal helicase domain-containing protein, partial [Treponema sp.]|nr:C-terminal helicase domain-containing protein [Treponema sp.]